MPAARISNDDVRRVLRDRSTPGEPAWQDDDGKVPAIVLLIIPTLVRPELDAAQAAKFVVDDAAHANQRAANFLSLHNAGWSMLPPDVMDPDQGYTDIAVRFPKRLVTAAQAEEEARGCLSTSSGDTWSLGWNFRDGEVDWWMEI